MHTLSISSFVGVAPTLGIIFNNLVCIIHPFYNITFEQTGVETSVIPFFRISLTRGSDFWRYFNNEGQGQLKMSKVKAEILPKYHFMADVPKINAL